MLETRQTNRFALLFFLYFIGVTLGLAFFPPFYSLSYTEQSMLDYVLAFLPPICFYFLFTKKSPRETLRLKPLGWKNMGMRNCSVRARILSCRGHSAPGDPG